MFRDSPRAFASDSQALTLSKKLLDATLPESFGKWERQFLALPLMHSEALEDQERCVDVLGSRSDPNSFAMRHLAIIKQWGRFRIPFSSSNSSS